MLPGAQYQGRWRLLPFAPFMHGADEQLADTTPECLPSLALGPLVCYNLSKKACCLNSQSTDLKLSFLTNLDKEIGSIFKQAYPPVPQAADNTHQRFTPARRWARVKISIRGSAVEQRNSPTPEKHIRPVALKERAGPEYEQPWSERRLDG